jgi:hypothetical protein
MKSNHKSPPCHFVTVELTSKSHRQAGAMLNFLLSLKANKEMFEQKLNVSFL